MNTPSHLLINEAVIGSRPTGRLWAVLVGAVTPDVPIFLFYVYEKLILHAPEMRIWRQDYAASAVQPLIDVVHSFPLILMAFAIAVALRKELLKAYSLSMLLHACEDFPLHHTDAHRQFFPFSDYRFRSPISYWDPRYYGAWGAALEFALTAAAVVVLLRRHPDRRARAAWIGVWLLEPLPFVYWG